MSDLYCEITKHISEARSIDFLEVVPEDLKKDVFPKWLQEKFTQLLRGAFDSNVVSDAQKYHIQMLLKKYFSEFPEMHSFWTGPDLSHVSLDSHDQQNDDCIDFFWSRPKGFIRSVDKMVDDDFLDMIEMKFHILDSFFLRDFCDIITRFQDINGSVLTLQECFCALTGCLHAKIMHISETKYQPFLSLYFRFFLFSESIKFLGNKL